MSYANLSNANLERLAMIAEEASETARAAMRVLRFGYEGHPTHTDVDNRVHLSRKVGNLLDMIEELAEAGDTIPAEVQFARDRRQEHKPKYTIHQTYSRR